MCELPVGMNIPAFSGIPAFFYIIMSMLIASAAPERVLGNVIHVFIIWAM